MSICEGDFIPGRMVNTAERLVSAARDMEQIRHGKDVLKVVFLVTCVETLQNLIGKSGSKVHNCSTSLTITQTMWIRRLLLKILSLRTSRMKIFKHLNMMALNVSLEPLTNTETALLMRVIIGSIVLTTR